MAQSITRGAIAGLAAACAFAATPAAAVAPPPSTSPSKAYSGEFAFGAFGAGAENVSVQDYSRYGYRDRSDDQHAIYGEIPDHSKDDVARCVNAAESRARGSAGFRYAKVTQVHVVKRTRFGIRVEGRISLKGARGLNRLHGFNRGKFACYVDWRGRTRVDLSGVRHRR